MGYKKLFFMHSGLNGLIESLLHRRSDFDIQIGFKKLPIYRCEVEWATRSCVL